MRRSLAPSQRNKLNSPLTPKQSNLYVSPQPIPPVCKQSFSGLSSATKESRDTGDPASCVVRSFSVVYGKPSKKKHKTWDGDGILEVSGKSALLKDTNGKVIGQSGNLKKCEFEDGAVLFVGSKEVEISYEMCQKTCPEVTVNAVKRKSSCTENQVVSPIVKKDRKTLDVLLGSSSIKTSNRSKLNVTYQPLLMPSPSDSHQWHCNPDNLPVTPVCIEGFLCKVLRKHQREGVTFLYNCTTGLRDVKYRGAILADEMGLGKTLQCITLMWTLLKQGPYGNVPLAKKILVVVPSSLVQNWKNEFTRWIGSHKIQCFVVDKNNRPKDFSKSRSPVLIISYEMFVKSHEDVKEAKFDLMICDEGHRLKNSTIRVTGLLNGISCTSRVILTGTPIQNDLQEFYALVDFVNPGILGSPAEFGRDFEKPILESKEPQCSPEALEIGKIKSDELNAATSSFILRRTQELIGKYLPHKTDYVVFCEATELQKKLYSLAIGYWAERMDDLGSREVPKHLSVITALKKICNHPFLLNSPCDSDDESLGKILQDYTKSQFTVQDSGKLMVVESIVRSIVGTNERLILVSNFTQTLDILAKVCSRHECTFLRFDGSTPVSQRSTIVAQFNNPKSSVQVLLLSSKAGGVGLNLIGGSRLVLYDSDWNPATDLQAMARIWREGQTKSVYVCRLLTSGTVEEKIFQRQLKKTALSENIVDSSESSCVKLSREELKDLFAYSQDDKCLTHESLGCSCPGDGSITAPVRDDSYDSSSDQSDRDCQIELRAPKAPTSLRMNQLLQWEHHRPPVSETVINEILEDTVVCITVHRCEPLRMKDLHKRPSVRVHLIDTRTGSYRRSAFGKNSVDVVQTQAFDHIRNRSVVPCWDEDLILMEPASHVVAADCILIFELLEAETDDVIAWGFLKPLAANGKQNVGTVLRLQLYKPLKSRTPKTDDIPVPLAFTWYSKNKMSAYKSTLLVSLHSIDEQLVVRPVSPVAPCAVPSRSRRRSSQLSSSPVKNMKLSEAEKELIGVVWSRLPSLSCKLPNKINSSLPAGPDGGMSVCYSRSGLLVACHTSNTISIFTYRGSRYLTLTGHHGLVYDLNWSPDDSFLLSSSADTTACVWNIKLKQTTPVTILSHPSYVYCGTWVGPSLAVTGCYDRALRLWDLAGVPTLLPQNTSVSSSSGLTKTSTYDPLQCVAAHKGRINTLAVLSSDEILVSGDSEGALLFWKLSTTLPRQLELSREARLRELKGQVINKVSAHPGGKRILVASRDSKLRMVDVQSLSVIQWFHGGVNSKLQSGSCFCGCGSRVLSCSEDGSVFVWDANTGERIALYRGLYLQDSPAALTFHPKDNMFALVSHKVGTFPSVVLSLFTRDASGCDIGIEWTDSRSEKLGSSSSVSDLSLRSSRESVGERPVRKKKKGILRALLQGGTKSKNKKGIANDAYTDTESGEGTATEANRTERKKRSAYRILDTLDSDGEVNSRLTDIIRRMDSLIMTASPSRPQVY